MDAGERYSLSALVALYRLEPELRDVYVEGRTDAGLLSWYLKERGIAAKIYAVDDRVEIGSEVVHQFGFEVGARGRVLSFATYCENELGAHQNAVTCVVDADYMRLVGPVPPPMACLLATDGAALECYFMQRRPIEKLLRLALKAQITVQAEDLIAAVGPALLDVYSVRAALFTFNIPCVVAVEKSCTLKTGASEGSIESIVHKSMSGLRRSDWPISPIELATWAQRLRNAPNVDQEIGYGHDIARLLIACLKVKGPMASVEAFEVAMRLSLEVDDLIHFPLFQSLESRLVS